MNHLHSLALVSLLAATPVATQVEMKRGDHVVLIGNGLADRMQHHGWLETYLQCALPEHQLVVRNHGYAGDRIDKRPRNRGFPSVDTYLTLSKADVIFAMFGFNESFDDNAFAFLKAVGKWIDDTRKKNYSGDGAPRIVLFTPIAHENLGTPNLPDGKANNKRLADIAMALKMVGQQKEVPVIDLFEASQKLYRSSKTPLTLNGIHLTNEGNRLLAGAIATELLGQAPKIDDKTFQAVNQAVLDKNWHWFNRYRATDGNDVWGSRAGLKFTDGQTNSDVLQHELIQLDVMTANRDRVVWAAANGKQLVADDSNVPPPIPVKTNIEKPQKQGGVSKTGTTDYLTAADSLKRITLPNDLQGNVFASEEMFPELVNPVQLGVDTKGRLWAAAWKTYPKWEPTGVMDDRLLILPDEDRDGVADKAITFAHVHNPTGFEFWNGGVIVASAPDLLFLKDTDGDDKADVRIRILHGLDSADTHHTANNFVFGPDGFLYYQRGVFHVSNVESPWKANQQSGASAMYRFNPRTYEFGYVATNNPNPHGISFDYWGYQYATDGTGGRCHQVKPTGNGFKMRKLLNHSVRPVASSGILSSAHLPEKYEGNFVLCNTIAFLGMKHYRLNRNPESGDVNGEELENFLVSKDPNFRPTDFEVGDDGAVYVSDWSNAIIGHMQHNIRDPNRDHTHGRIFRISAKGRPLAPSVAIDGQPIAKLLEALENPVNGVRQRARVELSERDTKEVIAATNQWLTKFDIANPAHAHHFLEGLWLFQQHNVKNHGLLHLCLHSPEPHARLAARRVEQDWNTNSSKPAEIQTSHDHDKKPAEPVEEGTIVIKTLVEKMMYDKTEIRVKAGQPVKIRFENPDYMPHNIVFAQPNTAEELGNAAALLGADGFKMNFVPKSKKIIAASRLVNHGESQTLEFTAPKKKGKYTYVCTFPGHWMLMKGTMLVQ